MRSPRSKFQNHLVFMNFEGTRENILHIVFLLVSNITNGIRLHQFLGTKTTEANKSLKTDANGAN